ncbi:MAG TPA: NAD(P)/FAD-dependent oxidoreductase [Candidatus Limnocylindria bacterium]|nr:NAD(P)/FAD-dependent oxidoreductase [Candidatus Limnocylindria bacterium]
MLRRRGVPVGEAARRYDAVVVGAGPNGLGAAITLARAGRSVLVVEARSTVGGGTRSAALTLPGFIHDVCSAVHPLGRASPVFGEWPLAEHGLEWIEPPVAIAHPLDDGSAALVHRSLDATAASLGHDGDRYLRLFGPVARDWDLIARELLGPLRVGGPLRHPFALGRFGLGALQPATWLARRFRTPQARALLGGVAAHSFLQLDRPITGAFALTLLGSAHAVGWPIPSGGSQRIADALASYLRSLGGEIETGTDVSSLDALPPSRAVLLDLTPRQVLRLAGPRLGGVYRRQLRGYRYGPGVFKIDLAMDGPIPWANPALLQAGTVHLGGTMDELVEAERSVAHGRPAGRPFVLVSQPSLFDPSRAPDGKHVVWAYCHLPNGSRADMTDAILGQLERFAPGIGSRILGRSTLGPAALEKYNANYVGGDINGGMQDLWQLWTRPAIRLDPYSTPDPSLFICSSSTPPGGGVHGLCGYHAAQSALRGVLR